MKNFGLKGNYWKGRSFINRKVHKVRTQWPGSITLLSRFGKHSDNVPPCPISSPSFFGLILIPLSRSRMSKYLSATYTSFENGFPRTKDTRVNRYRRCFCDARNNLLYFLHHFNLRINYKLCMVHICREAESERKIIRA